MTFRYLRRESIITINKLTVARHGGNYLPPENLLNPEALEYLVESVQAELFGVPLYPTVADKSALYMFNIISNHIFQDGNKRTGLEAAQVFFRANGYELRDKLDSIIFGGQEIIVASETVDDHLIDFTLALAAAEISLPACRQWFARNLRERAR